jgi:excisionase family DNA binding protein
MEALALQLPESLLDTLAERAAALVSDRLTDKPEYLGTSEAAEYLHWSKRRIDNLASQRRIPFRQDVEGGKRVFVRQELDAWIAGLGGVSVSSALANR